MFELQFEGLVEARRSTSSDPVNLPVLTFCRHFAHTCADMGNTRRFVAHFRLVDPSLVTVATSFRRRLVNCRRKILGKSFHEPVETVSISTKIMPPKSFMVGQAKSIYFRNIGRQSDGDLHPPNREAPWLRTSAC